MSVTKPTAWTGHAPDLVRDNKLMHEEIARLTAELAETALGRVHFANRMRDAEAERDRLRAQIRNGYCTECGSGPGECAFANQEGRKCCPDCQHAGSAEDGGREGR